MEMEAFLADYLRDSSSVVVLADFRYDPGVVSDNDVERPALQPGTDVHGLRSTHPPDPDRWVYPDDVDVTDVLTEGAVKPVVVNAYERNPEARRRCIEHYGAACFVCGLDFARMYGTVVHGYIHVHHLKVLWEIGSEYIVDPVSDLRSICPNCHAVVHSRDPQYTMDEVRALIAIARTQ
jgi:hypothetical protein